MWILNEDLIWNLLIPMDPQVIAKVWTLNKQMIKYLAKFLDSFHIKSSIEFFQIYNLIWLLNHFLLFSCAENITLFFYLHNKWILYRPNIQNECVQTDPSNSKAAFGSMLLSIRQFLLFFLLGIFNLEIRWRSIHGQLRKVSRAVVYFGWLKDYVISYFTNSMNSYNTFKARLNWLNWIEITYTHTNINENSRTHNLVQWIITTTTTNDDDINTHKKICWQWKQKSQLKKRENKNQLIRSLC